MARVTFVSRTAGAHDCPIDGCHPLPLGHLYLRIGSLALSRHCGGQTTDPYGSRVLRGGRRNPTKALLSETVCRPTTFARRRVYRTADCSAIGVLLTVVSSQISRESIWSRRRRAFPNYQSSLSAAYHSKEGGLALGRDIRWGCSGPSAWCKRTADAGRRKAVGTAPPTRDSRAGLIGGRATVCRALSLNSKKWSKFMTEQRKPTIVFCHGIWADGSSSAR
jgi:hypothetical protein